jgi:hypothetical protein
MNTAVLCHLLGMGLVALLIRLGGGPEDLLTQSSVVGWLLVLTGLVLSIKSRPSDPGAVAARRWRLRSQAVGVAGLMVLTALGLDMLSGLGVNAEASGRIEVVAQALTALLLLVGTLPLITVDRVAVASPVKLPESRVSAAGFLGLSLALALALLVPLNHLASANNIRWDHSYFKTASPGDITLATIENLDEPIQAWLFFPHTLDVTEEIRTYFDLLDGPKFEVSYVDQALDTELARELRVQKNGVIALVLGTGDEQQVQRIRIGETLDKASRKLKKLDRDVSKALLSLAADPKKAYFTVGHGEMYWKKSSSTLPARTIEGMRDELKRLNFKITELGAIQGLASEIPEDADLVVVMGPTEAFMVEELTALDTYRRSGGALWLALDPGTEADMGAVLSPLGLAYDSPAMLVGDTNVWVATRRITDRYNIFTNKASTHPSVKTLSRNAKTRALLTPLAAPIKLLNNQSHKVEVTLRTLSEVWLDTSSNLQFDSKTEERKGWPLAVAVTGIEDDSGAGEFRVLVTGDATWASDLVLPLSMGNQEFLRDGLAWLVDQPASSGTVNSEKDVKIRHTKGDDAWMFYGTTLVIPVLIFGLGLVRVRSRRQAGVSASSRTKA